MSQYQDKTKIINLSNLKSSSTILPFVPTCECGKIYPPYGELHQYNPANLFAGTHCKNCKTDSMIFINKILCLCRKTSPTYAYPGEAAICCLQCKNDDMIRACGQGGSFQESLLQKSKSIFGSKNTQSEEPRKPKGQWIQPRGSCRGFYANRCPGVQNQQCPQGKYSTRKYDNFCIACFQKGFPEKFKVIQAKIQGSNKNGVIQKLK